MNKGGVSHCGLAIYVQQNYLKAKEEELWKNSIIFHHAINIIFKKSYNRNQNPSRY
jgi:hypothetical protein